jgi:putative PIN family toxin of toxin-antitoxin system
VIRVVIDANVLVSAALARDPAAPSLRAFDALLDERIEVVGCPVLLGEVASVLGRDRLRRYLSIDEAGRFVADLAAVMSLVADPPPPHPAVCRDPDDDYLVALARAARVDALVTGDRDLLVLEDIGVPVITPRALVEELADAR